MGNRHSNDFSPPSEELIIIQGLYDAGKSTILNKLTQEGTMLNPDYGTNLGIFLTSDECIRYRDIKVTTWNCGGRGYMRPVTRFLYDKVTAIVFVVDSSSTENIETARYELQESVQEKGLESAVFLVLANKQDLPRAMSVEEVSQKMGLDTMKQTGTIFGTSGQTGKGLSEALDWLYTTLDEIKSNETKTEEAAKDQSKCRLLTKAGGFFSKGLKSVKHIIGGQR